MNSQASPFYVLLVFFYTTDPLVYTLPVDKWDQHVHTEAFNRECSAQSKRLSSSSSGSDLSEHIKLREKDDSSSSSSNLTSAESSSHVVPKLEANLYYFGIRGRRQLGPKLVYRMSEDVFPPPSRPEQDPATMHLLPTSCHNTLRHVTL